MKKHSRKAVAQEDMSLVIEETIRVFYRRQRRFGEDMSSAEVTEIQETRLLGVLEQELHAVPKQTSKKTLGEIGVEVACIISAHLLGELLGKLWKDLIRYQLQGIVRMYSLCYRSLSETLSQGWRYSTTLGTM